MNRRDFIVRATTATLAVSAGVFLPRVLAPEATFAELSLPGRRLRGTGDGKVLESLDDGENWQVLAKFGAHCAVRRLAEHGGEVTARLTVNGYPFQLRSTDLRTWRTL